MEIAVIGAGGFVGRFLVKRLFGEGHQVRSIVRRPAGLPGEQVVDDIATANWASVLAGVDVVVHLAARVHMMQDDAKDPLTEFRRVNTEGTIILAEAAARAGVRRFVFLSTIKVNGEKTEPGRPFRASDTPQASDPYGISKQEAEAALIALAKRTGMEVTIIRPPLIYGPGVKGNLRSLINAIRRGVPLPLGGITANRRSLVGLENLASLIGVAMVHPAAANEIFLVSDDDDVSTARLLQLLAEAMARKPRLLAIPASLIKRMAGLAGKSAAADRLVGSLQVDISNTCQKLGWTPPVSVSVGLRAAIDVEQADPRSAARIQTP